MRDIIKRSVISTMFIAGLAVLLLISSAVLCPKNNDKESGIIDPSANGILGEPENTIDVLVVGDSESYSSVIPLNIWKEYGITSYCCGTPLQLLSYSEQFINKAFVKQSPKVVILETNAVFRRISLWRALLNKTESVFSVFTYHDRWKSLNRNDLGGSISYTYTDDAKGYHYSGIISSADDSSYMEETSEKERIRSMNRRYVSRIKELCESKGAELVLLSTPSTVNWNTARHNAITELAAELGVDYIDMNMLRKEIPINWKTDTRDEGDHMNYFGAEKVSAYLGRYLAENKHLESHKNDAAYRSWDEAQKKFSIKTDKLIIKKQIKTS